MAMREGPVHKIIQGLAAGVGLASETIQHHKEKKRLQTAEGERSAGSQGMSESGTSERQDAGETPVPENRDEVVWQLDEAQEDLGSQVSPQRSSSTETEADEPSVSTPNSTDGATLADQFIRDHPPEYSELSPARHLELPVILTQRRPKARTRGFIRAYAPVLEDVGIDQQTFLDFVDKLNKAIQPNPWIQAINLASFAAQHVPEPVTLAVSIACKMVADAAAETHSRTKTNAFLDSVNEEFFKPRGVIAILMTWKPSDASIITSVDFNLGSTMAKATPDTSGVFAKLKHRIQPSHGASSFEFPETAPLIFPTIDELAASTSGNPEIEAKKQHAFKRGGQFLVDYTDRRAVAKWASDNPESTLANAAPKPEFRSRYADPSHPASSGDLLAFVTGGKFSGRSRRGDLGLAGGARGVARGRTARGGDVDRGSIMDGRLGLLEARGMTRLAEPRSYDQLNTQASRASLASESAPHEGQGEDRLQGGRHRGMERHQRPVRRGGFGGTGLGPLSPVIGLKKLLQSVSGTDCFSLILPCEHLESRRLADSDHRMFCTS